MGLVALIAALVLLGGPAFGLVVLATGGDLHVRDGAARIAFDLVLGSLLLVAARRCLTTHSAVTAA